MAAYLFNLPDLDFTMSFGDNQCCDRCGQSSFRISSAALQSSRLGALLCNLHLVRFLKAVQECRILNAITEAT